MNFRKAATAALNPAYWRALSQLVVPSIEHGPAFTGIEPSTIIDVGANKGQFATFAATRWPEGRIISFEPLDGPGATFGRVLGKRATLLKCALGEEPATLNIHIASKRDSSSLLPLGKLQKKLFSMDEVGTQPVSVMRLDDALRDRDIKGPALLKIDVQGFEYEVLLGVGELRKKIDWMYIEVSFTELYTGQKLFPEIETLARELGFECRRFFNQIDDHGKPIQADALFEKTSNGIIN